MTKNRLENFSDAVIAIILTIMILELKIPHTTNWNEIFSLYPLFISYILSFVFIGIYWVNHHHLLHTLKHVNAKVMWANLLLLFSLSLIPWATGFMGENHFEKNTVVIYTFLCILPALAFTFFSKTIIGSRNPDKQALDILQHMKFKEKLSTVMYIAAFIASFYLPLISLILIFIVSGLWILPNKEIEKLFD